MFRDGYCSRSYTVIPLIIETVYLKKLILRATLSRNEHIVIKIS